MRPDAATMTLKLFSILTAQMASKKFPRNLERVDIDRQLNICVKYNENKELQYSSQFPWINSNDCIVLQLIAQNFYLASRELFHRKVSTRCNCESIF